jgi:YD repeat-containing protein
MFARLAFALLLAAAACWPLIANADSYPSYYYRAESLTADGSQAQFAYSRSSCVAAFSQLLGYRCFTGSRISLRQSSAPACESCQVDVISQCLYQDDGLIGPVLESCSFGGFCPYGGEVSGANCITPSCPSGQVRDPDTGQCGPINTNENLGNPDPSTCVANPCNAGTGTKFQVETIFRSGATMPLVEQISYNSRLLADLGSVWNGSYGKGWKSHYGRQIALLSTGVVLARRASGKQLDFGPPASGNVFVAKADVADRLERLADGGGSTTGWKYTVAADDSIELYDPSGRLLSISDRAGSTLTLSYSNASTPPSIAPGPGFLIGVSDPWGRAISYTYNAQSRVSRVTDPAGGTYDFVRDGNDNLVSITFPDTRVRQYRYNEQEHTQGTALPYSLTGIIDENGARFATFKYDTQGRVVSSEHAGGVERTTLDYPSQYVSTTVTDPLGVARSYGLTILLGVVKGAGITGAACPSCGPASQAYDANGNVASRTDWNGNRTNYGYDLARNLETSRTEALTAAGAATPQTRTISTQWHGSFRLPAGIAEPLRITTFTYDPDGAACGAKAALCSKSVQATTDTSGSMGFSATSTGAPRTWSYTYNATGQVLSMDGPRTDAADTTTYTYDPTGNLASITNAAGHLTSFTSYNAHGQPLTIVDPNALPTTLAYDGRQRLRTRSVGGEVTTYDYDFAGQLTRVTLPDGSFLLYGYDDAHRLTSMEDNQGSRVVYTLDAMGNRTQEQVRDPGNNLAQTRSRVYSNLNRLFQELGAQNQTTEYAYDDQGNVLTVKDPLNRITTSQYDALNRLRQVTDPAPVSGVTQYAYNGLDALTQVTDPRNLVTGYTVDGLGKLTQQQSPDTGTTVNTYDAAGNLLTQTDAKSQVTAYAYDVLNRVTLITFHDGSKQAYAYDQGTNGIGRLSSITETDPANQVTSVIAYAYDQKGRVTSETRTVNAVQYVLAYRYDSSGRLDQLTYPSGRTVTYTFDSVGRVNQVSTEKGGQSQVVAQSVTYHPFGGVKAYTLGNGQVYSRSYDLDGRIDSYTLGSQSFGIGYDAASRIEFISDLGTPANSNSYGYDALDRLTSAVLPGSTYGYLYDAVGNRLTRSTGSSTDTYAYDSTSNRIVSITPTSGPVRSFTFDANGSTTADGTNTYVYDTRGRMAQATSSLGVTSYQVNALGQRIRKTNSLTDRVFHYDTRGRLIAETDPAGAFKRELIYLGDIPVGVVQ